ncbi:MAG: hypothetical protein FP813_13240 [Desulfurivibrio sp.]|nr:hypothetical protein [Desulfurivibrio sp.]
MNEHTEPALVRVQADWLLGNGALVKDLFSGETGTGKELGGLKIAGDGYRLFYITPAEQSQEEKQPQKKKATN